MILTDEEKAMLDGKEGRAVQKAMDLLVRYGEALGAEKLVDTNNVCGALTSTNPFMRDYAMKLGQDAVFSQFTLDSDEIVPIPKVKANSYQLIQSVDPTNGKTLGASQALLEANAEYEEYVSGLGVNLLSTCTPYQVGNVPVKGEICAWMESSAVIYINSVLGARTNVEGRESTGAAMLTGKIPYWGFHIDENRLGTDLIEVELDVETMMDWGLLGYAIGDMVGERVPVIDRIMKVPDRNMLKHFGAAAASSGGVEMYHIPSITAEARTVQEAFGKNTPKLKLTYGKEERRKAYERLNASAKSTEVDFIMFGCPHASIDQVWNIARLLDGKKINSNTDLWVFTPRALREVADRNGYTRIIEAAGGKVISDTCPAIGQMMPEGTKVVATDSAKQAHYLPAIMGVETWFGSLEDCIDAAITGKWRGEL
ncbi:aconitase X [Bacillus sp. Marseille-P3661]|uniref:aconitase X n=1 Tax=Bacillus sp. Marseille-P3661 TaxID=1936234 RepID=UPI000C84B09C|nr:aconitase X catalytic domain-containing protein [Bacillus sp. Marseille-P3661]